LKARGGRHGHSARLKLLSVARASIALAGGLSHAASTASAAPASDNPLASELDRDVAGAASQFLANACHVGLSIAAVRDRTVSFYDYGSVSRERAQLATPDSIYELGSVTKTFTGALAAQAVVQRRMELDADFRKYLPEPYPNLTWHGQPFTLRALATHRSGLPRDLPSTDDLYARKDYERLPFQLIARDGPYDRERYLRELHDVQLTSAPGTTEAYSNLGPKVIGFGLEKVTETPFETLVARNILQPLGMSSTGFDVDSSQRSRLVDGFSRGGNLMPYHLRNAGAAYGLYSTTRDMAKYLSWQLDETNPVIRLAHQPLEGEASEGKALIWNLALDPKGKRMLWHGGGTFGTTSQVVLYPDDQQAFVLLANDTCEGTESALKGIAVKVHRGLAH